MSGSDRFAQLWSLLPAVYRERDPHGDLARLLTVHGEVLQALYDTLRQLQRDRFPEPDAPDDPGCQPWVLPYLADLLDVELVSPDVDGQRAEVANAVAWRQGKGTLRVLQAIAESLLGLPVAVEEGWRRVAVTARVDTPRLPAAAYGESRDYRNCASPVYQAGHPGLPAVTVDLRRPARAVQRDDGPGWRIRHPHGVPCFPGSHQDRAPRTVDVRTLSPWQGHAHPRTVLVFHAPRDGFFPPRPPTLTWRRIADGEADPALLRIERDDSGERPRIRYRGLTATPLRIRGVIELHTPAHYEFENIHFDNRVEIGEATVRLEGCAARHFHVESAVAAEPALQARHCLFNRVEVPRGRLVLEYCTVLRDLLAEHLDCSDSILLAPPRKDRGDEDVPRSGCIRYTALAPIPESARIADGLPSSLRFTDGTNPPVRPLLVSERFGEPGCGVLHPACDARIRFGAEDGGELGAYHGQRHVQRSVATLTKLAGFLPLGQQAVIVEDETLRCPPPRARD